MSETKELLEVLDAKVVQLLSNLKEMQATAVIKNQEIEVLKRELQHKNEAVALLENENETLKKVKPDGNQEELKDKIGEMVKEIDRCISLLKV